MSFDALAPHYRWMELVLAGGKLQRCRTAFLDEIPAARNILLVGEGHGRCLVECRRRFEGAQITCLDASAGMLTQARRQLQAHNLSSDQVQFVRADVLKWTFTEKTYDLIVTNFLLDCFRPDQLEALVFKLAAATTPNANWLIADFQVPGAGLRRIRSRLIIWMMYLFFRAVARLPARKLTVPDSFLQNAGFVLHRHIEAEWGLLRSDWWRRS